MSPRTIHLKLTGVPTPAWTDAHATASPRAPFLLAGSAATMKFLVTDIDADTVVDPTGLSAITVEIYRNRTAATLLAAPDAVAIADATVTLEQWASDTSAHISVDLTAAETEAILTDFDDEAGNLDAWMEVRATLSGANCFLGAGPLRIYRGALGGTPPDAGNLYYTQSQVDALIAAGSGITVSGGVASVTIGGTTHSWPVGSAS